MENKGLQTEKLQCNHFNFTLKCTKWLSRNKCNAKNFQLLLCSYYRGQPKAGTGLKMLFVPFVFSKSRFQGPASRCDKIVVIVTLLEAIEGIPGKDYNFWGNENFHNLYERLLHGRKVKTRVDI